MQTSARRLPRFTQMSQKRRCWKYRVTGTSQCATGRTRENKIQRRVSTPTRAQGGMPNSRDQQLAPSHWCSACTVAKHTTPRQRRRRQQRAWPSPCRSACRRSSPQRSRSIALCTRTIAWAMCTARPDSFVRSSLAAARSRPRAMRHARKGPAQCTSPTDWHAPHASVRHYLRCRHCLRQALHSGALPLLGVRKHSGRCLLTVALAAVLMTVRNPSKPCGSPHACMADLQAK